MSTDKLNGTLSSTGNLNGTFGTSGGGGTSNYNDLTNKPQINGNTLEGNKTPAQLGINIPDMTNYYNKSETNTLLDGKANVSDLPDMNDYYDKSETDTLLDGKVNNSSFNAASLPITSGSATNTKAYIDSGLSGKADTSTIPIRSDFIRYEDKTIGAIEFTNAYYLLPSGSRPSVPSGYMFLMGIMLDYGSIQSGTSALINIDQNGTYLFGIAGSKYSNVKVRYIYIKN